MRPHQPIWQATLGLLISLGLTGTAVGQTTAGRVDFAIGGVSASGKDGLARPLTKGALVFSGDTVNTVDNARVQIRFTDGAYVSLQPQTQYRVDDYRYGGPTSEEEKGFFSLLKGGLRTITGVIGHRNKEAYQVYTTTATIGIRGTEYLAKVTNSLEVSVGEGSLFLVNNAGKFVVEQGQSVYVANQNTVPVVTQTPPSLPPAPAKQSSKAPDDKPVFVVSEETTPSGKAAIVPAVPTGFGSGLTPGSGYSLSVSLGGGDKVLFDCAASNMGCGDPVVTLSNTGGVSWVQFPDGDIYGVLGFFPAGTITGTQGTATWSGGSAGGVIGWGSFTNGTVITNGGFTGPKIITLGPNEGLHYVIGVPTSPMPTTGIAYMDLIGATRPTFSDNVGGGLGIGTVTSGSLTANFGTARVSTTLNMAFSSGNNFVYSAGSSIFLPTAGFYADGTFSKVSGPSTLCSSGCTGVGNGLFAGPAAKYAGYGYMVTVPGATKTFQINGAAAFQTSSKSAP